MKAGRSDTTNATVAIDRLLALVTSLAVVVASGASVHRIAAATWLEWNDGRLAASAALALGYDLYQPDGEGVLMGHVYGPISGLYYLGALAVTSTPAAAVWVGSAMSFLVYSLPALLLLLVVRKHVTRRCGRSGGWLPVVGGFALFWLATFQQRMLLGPAFNIHADAPALGFGALACAFLLLAGELDSPRAYTLAAAFTILSVGTKQVMVFLPITLIAFVGFIHGRQALTRFVIALLVSGTVIVAIVSLWVDFDAMMFNAVTVNSRHPWRGEGGVAQLIQSFRDLAPRVVGPALVIGAACLPDLLTRRLRFDNWRDWTASHGWSLVVLVGLVNIPMALLGRSKIGGSLSALAFSGYFLFVGSTMALVQASLNSRRLRGLAARSVSRGALIVLLVVATAATSPALWPDVGFRERIFANPESAAYEFALLHPGLVYFPFHPLVSIMTEGQPYHFSDALYARELAGYEVTQSQFNAGVPEQLTWVATNRSFEDYSLRYLPMFTEEVRIADLPGWVVYVRKRPPTRPYVPLAGDPPARRH